MKVFVWIKGSIKMYIMNAYVCIVEGTIELIIKRNSISNTK
jgi:hypothetical protein